MEWLLANTQIHSTFASLGGFNGECYAVSEDCMEILEEINYKLSIEDQTLRTFRRAIGFGQNIRNDIIPLLVHTKDEKILEVTIRILVNLTIPVECLLPVETMMKNDVGRHTIFELNKLLIHSKESFTDSKTTKSILDYIKTLLERDGKLSIKNCDNINNCLLLLRNILHIPEQLHQSYFSLASTSMQNQIVWNLFTQSVDKLLLHLMTCQQRAHWSVTMVQLIALMYKDQHVSTLQKLLNIWFEASISESSEDNESNTSPPKQCSGDSSPMLTSDPTSDSSDNGGTSKIKSSSSSLEDRRSPESETAPPTANRIENNFQAPASNHKAACNKKGKSSFCKTSGQEQIQSTSSPQQSQPIRSPKGVQQLNAAGKKMAGMGRDQCRSSMSEISDCGYGTQVENPESISTSSTEDYGKPAHQKPPPNQKQRFNAANKVRSASTAQDKTEWRRKKLVKRSRSNMINMKGLLHHTPTDEDISNILKEFTVDFLLKGYGYLVQELHAQLLTDLHLQIDTSHFFWLVTYFLKFAAQLELELEHINSVLSFEIVGYLTFEATSLCEQLELSSRQTACDLKPCLRRMHLVVTAIREFLQAMDTYKKINHLSQEDKDNLRILQLQIASTKDLKFLFVLLLRKYNPSIQSKQYLQDLIVTNHMLLLLLDSVAKMPEFRSHEKITDHIQHFATVEIMNKYGLLLENFNENGEFVNDCVFTMMHHVGGDLGQVTTLFQPIILKTFTRIWETDYELCDDWSDLVEYVIHKFINTPQNNTTLEYLPSADFHMETRTNTGMSITVTPPHNGSAAWGQEDIDTLYWYYIQNQKSSDIIGNIVQQFDENESKSKSRIDVIQQLLHQEIITQKMYADYMKAENVIHEEVQSNDESGIDVRNITPTTTGTGSDRVFMTPTDDIQILRDQLFHEIDPDCLTWLQEYLLECCFIKLNIKNGNLSNKDLITDSGVQIMEPIPYTFIRKKQSIPIIPWTSYQIAISGLQPFMLLLHKLGFHLATDAGKVFVRVPEFWTEDFLYNISIKLGPLEKCHIKFDLSLLNIPQCSSTPLTSPDEHEEPLNHFGISRSKTTNSIIRFTPETANSTTNWMEIVLKNKFNQINSKEIEEDRAECQLNKIISSHRIAKPGLEQTAQRGDLLEMELDQRPADDGIKVEPKVERYDEEVEGVDIDIKASPLFVHVEMGDRHDAISTCESASVASDLTRMCVSDEDDTKMNR